MKKLVCVNTKNANQAKAILKLGELLGYRHTAGEPGKAIFVNLYSSGNMHACISGSEEVTRKLSFSAGVLELAKMIEKKQAEPRQKWQQVIVDADICDEYKKYTRRVVSALIEELK